MEITHHYTVLGLAPGASRAAVRQAYKALALKYHPDLNPSPDAAQRFRQINLAHTVLKVHQGADPVQTQQAASDSFRSLLASLQPANAAPTPAMASATLAISLEEANSGIDRLVTLDISDTGPEGQLRTRTRQRRLTLPAGLREGQYIELAGSRQHPPLQLKIIYKAHALFHGDGPDLHLKLPVSQELAANGGQLKVPTLTGQTIVQVPADARNGDKIRLVGRGLSGPLSGDLYVTLYIETASARGRSACAIYRRTAHQGFRRDASTPI